MLLQVRAVLTPLEGSLEGPVWERESVLASELELELVLALVLDQDLVTVKG